MQHVFEYTAVLQHAEVVEYSWWPKACNQHGVSTQNLNFFKADVNSTNRVTLNSQHCAKSFSSFLPCDARSAIAWYWYCSRKLSVRPSVDDVDVQWAYRLD